MSIDYLEINHSYSITAIQQYFENYITNTRMYGKEGKAAIGETFMVIRKAGKSQKDPAQMYSFVLVNDRNENHGYRLVVKKST